MLGLSCFSCWFEHAALEASEIAVAACYGRKAVASRDGYCIHYNALWTWFLFNGVWVHCIRERLSKCINAVGLSWKEIYRRPTHIERESRRLPSQFQFLQQSYDLTTLDGSTMRWIVLGNVTTFACFGSGKSYSKLNQYCLKRRCPRQIPQVGTDIRSTPPNLLLT